MKAMLNDLLNAKGVSEPLREAAKALIGRLEAAEKERDALRAAVRHEADCVEACKSEIERLRAENAGMEKQGPARLVTATAYRWRYRGAVKWQYGELTEETARVAKEHNHEVQPLYAIPGAQNVPSAPDVDALAQFIREIDGKHQLGAGALAERIVEWLAAVPEAKP